MFLAQNNSQLNYHNDKLDSNVKCCSFTQKEREKEISARVYCNLRARLCVWEHIFKRIVRALKSLVSFGSFVQMCLSRFGCNQTEIENQSWFGLHLNEMAANPTKFVMGNWNGSSVKKQHFGQFSKQPNAIHCAGILFAFRELNETKRNAQKFWNKWEMNRFGFGFRFRLRFSFQVFAFGFRIRFWFIFRDSNFQNWKFGI